jgi:hypothetical protein
MTSALVGTLDSSDPEGKLTLVREATHDVTGRIRAEGRLREAKAFWQATLDSGEDPASN